MESVDHKKETHDFMNVESFSQLPFIRPTLPKETGIRLFGKEFGLNEPGPEESHIEESKDIENNSNSSNKKNGDQSNRKFECHYCCRNFPTSQALGGHQNAHKRERQHAKRAHLHSSMMYGSCFREAGHGYGVSNYHHFGNSRPPTALSASPFAYQPWSRHQNTNNYARFYGSNIENYPQSRVLQVHSSTIRGNLAYSESNNNQTIMKQMPSSISQNKLFGFESRKSTITTYNRPDNVSLDLCL